MSKYIAIDTEHGGFHPGATLLTAAFVVFDLDSGPPNFIDDLEVAFKWDTYNIDPLALEVNKIDIATHHKGALELKECKHLIRGFLNKHSGKEKEQLIPVGSGVASDISFMKDRGIGLPSLSHKVRDITTIARFLQDCGILKSEGVSLEKLASHFRYKYIAHNASQDAQMSALVYWELIRLAKGHNCVGYEGYLG